MAAQGRADRAVPAAAAQQPGRDMQLVPQAFRLDELAQRVLTADGDSRRVTADPHARYFGAELDSRGLTPGGHPRIGPTRFEAWIGRR